MSNSTQAASGTVEVVILAGARTPQGRINGQLASLSAVQLGTHAIRGGAQRATLPESLTLSALHRTFQTEGWGGVAP